MGDDNYWVTYPNTWTATDTVTTTIPMTSSVTWTCDGTYDPNVIYEEAGPLTLTICGQQWTFTESPDVGGEATAVRERRNTIPQDYYDMVDIIESERKRAA